MGCWPAYFVGSITLAILIFDMVEKSWNDLFPHALGGILLTALFWGICLISTTLSASLLIVPSFAALIFILTIWITGESLKRRGCCMSCQPQQPSNGPSCGAPKLKAEPKCEDNTILKATQLM